MSVLGKSCGITRRDRRRNVDVLKELNVEKDIVQVLQTRRLTYFGHVNRMQTERYPDIQPQRQWGHELDLLGKCEVIGHMTIRLAIMVCIGGPLKTSFYLACC